MRLSSRQATLVGYVLVAALCYGLLRWFEPVRVSGGSMRPALHAGDLVLVAKDREVGPGDVALLRLTDRGPVLHRVTTVLEDGSVLTKGDANDVADATPTERPRIGGRVVAVVPVGRWLERWR
jgi:signal peptidase